MRFSHCVSVVTLSALATLALAVPDESAKRSLAIATANLEKGDVLLAEVSALKTNASRLATLDRALYFLRRARKVAVAGEPQFERIRGDASRSVVRALGDEAEIYYQRKSLSLAQKRAAEALAIDPADSRARNLIGRIEAAKSTDIHSNDMGSTAIGRIRERRAAAGIPLRDRGIGSRR